MTADEDPSRDATPVADPERSPPAEATSPAWDGSDPPPMHSVPAENEPAVEPQRSFAEDLRDLAGDAQTFLEAEKAYESARLSYALSRGRNVAVSFVVAAVLVWFAMIALVVGLLLALAPLLTPWGALAVVTLGLALAAFLFLRAGIKQMRRMRTFLGAGAVGAAAGGAGQ